MALVYLASIGTTSIAGCSGNRDDTAKQDHTQVDDDSDIGNGNPEQSSGNDILVIKAGEEYTLNAGDTESYDGIEKYPAAELVFKSEAILELMV